MKKVLRTVDFEVVFPPETPRHEQLRVLSELAGPNVRFWQDGAEGTAFGRCDAGRVAHGRTRRFDAFWEQLEDPEYSLRIRRGEAEAPCSWRTVERIQKSLGILQNYHLVDNPHSRRKSRKGAQVSEPVAEKIAEMAGKFTDRQIADAVGLTSGVVRRYRLRNGLPGMRGLTNRKVLEQIQNYAGEIPDRWLAEDLAVPKSRVARIRRSLGKPPIKESDLNIQARAERNYPGLWDNLFEASISDLTSEYGVSRGTVSKYRLAKRKALAEAGEDVPDTRSIQSKLRQGKGTGPRQAGSKERYAAYIQMAADEGITLKEVAEREGLCLATLYTMGTRLRREGSDSASE